jgi:hypothetical protein
MRVVDGTHPAMIPPDVIVALLQALVLVLQACQPTPALAASILVEPPEGQPVRRLYWQSRIAGVVAAHWPGDAAHVRAAQLGVLARLRDGVDVGELGELFAEVAPN